MSKENCPEMYLIVAMTRDGVIGNDNKTPWHISEDLKNFKRITLGGVVIMGRKTFESMGKTLPDRHNLVISKTLPSIKNAEVFSNIEAAVERAVQFNKKIFFIGGSEIFKKALGIVEYMYISWVYGSYKGDTRFPDFDVDKWDLIEKNDFEEFCLCFYRRI